MVFRHDFFKGTTTITKEATKRYEIVQNDYVGLCPFKNNRGNTLELKMKYHKSDLGKKERSTQVSIFILRQISEK